MDKKKSTILLSVSPEEKKAIQIAAASERRSVANFIKSIILDNQKVKEVLEQVSCNLPEKDEHKEVEEIVKPKEVPEQKQIKSKEVPHVEKQENNQTEEEIDMKNITRGFGF